MKVHFLGTGASPSMPLAFCSCEACRAARLHGGRNLRRRSSLLVDDVVLVDLGPDVTTASFDQSVSLAKVRLCAQTHPHADHFDPELIASRHPGWGTVPETALTILGSSETLDEVNRVVRRDTGCGSLFDRRVRELLRIELMPIEPFQELSFDRYRITAYPANHAAPYSALLYSIDDGAHSVFYACDTSLLADSVWDHMRERRHAYDLMVFDQTYGIGYESSDHLAAADVAAYAAEVRERGLLKPDGSVYVTHLSHEGIREHEELELLAAANGYHVAFDGLMLEL